MEIKCNFSLFTACFLLYIFHPLGKTGYIEENYSLYSSYSEKRVYLFMSVSGVSPSFVGTGFYSPCPFFAEGK